MFSVNRHWRAAYPALAESLDVNLSLAEAVAAIDDWAVKIDACD